MTQVALERAAPLPGMSAVVLPGHNLEQAVLDLAAVLEGLVYQNFEILLVTREGHYLAELQARAPWLPVRIVDGEFVGDGCAVAARDLIFVATSDGRFDVRELNRLLEAIDGGADV